MSGTAEADSSVAITWGGVTRTTTTDGDGNWSLAYSSAQVPTDQSDISVTATDAAGNPSASPTTHSVTIDTAAPSGATEFALTVDNTDNDAALEVGETITITFSEVVDVDTLVLGSQFAPNVLNRGDEAKLGYGYSVAATGGSSTATSFVITLGADTTANDLDLLVGTEAQRTLTFNKSAVVDAAGNPAASHIALVVPADSQKATAASTTHISTDVAATAAYADGETIRLVFSEAVDASLVTIENLTSSGTLGSSTIAAVSPTDGYATTFDITVAADATLAATNTVSIASSNVVDGDGSTGNGATISFTLPSIVTLQVAGSLNLDGQALGAAMDKNGWSGSVSDGDAARVCEHGHDD